MLDKYREDKRKMSEKLLELVKKGESEEVEFKKSTAQLVKYIEQWGTGTNDMVAGCINWGLPEPEFELVTGDLVVIYRKDIKSLIENLSIDLDIQRRDLYRMVQFYRTYPIVTSLMSQLSC